MSNLNDQHLVCGSSAEFRKPIDFQGSRKVANSLLNSNEVLSKSYENLNRPPLTHSTSAFGREASQSIGSSSLTSMLPGFMRSGDSYTGQSVTIGQHYTPRPMKTIKLFEVTLKALRDMLQLYSVSTQPNERLEGTDGTDMCTKITYRILLLQGFKDTYESMLAQKLVYLEEMRSSLTQVLSTCDNKEEFCTIDCESYCTVCREMCIIESKLERCCGRLQFQIIDLDSISRVCALDQYELSIRLNDGSKFKSRIKVEKNGRPVWEARTFSLSPIVDDVIDVKFIELKTLNKSLILLDRKVPYVNDLIVATPSIYTIWLTPIGHIKLRMIVQWSAQLDDLDLSISLSQIDTKYYDSAVRNGAIVRRRNYSDLSKQTSNRSSFIFSSIYRQETYERNSLRGSMNHITEQFDEDITSDINLRKGVITRSSTKTKAEYYDDNCEVIRLKDSSSSNYMLVYSDDIRASLTDVLNNYDGDVHEDDVDISYECRDSCVHNTEHDDFVNKQCDRVSKRGDSVLMQGDSVSMKSDGVLVQGDSVAMQDHSVPVQVNSVLVPGDDVLMPGDSVLIQGDSVLLQGDNVAMQSDGVPVQDDSALVQDDGVLLQGDSVLMKSDSVLMQCDGTHVQSDGALVPSPNIVNVLPMCCRHNEGQNEDVVKKNDESGREDVSDGVCQGLIIEDDVVLTTETVVSIPGGKMLLDEHENNAATHSGHSEEFADRYVTTVKRDGLMSNYGVKSKKILCRDRAVDDECNEDDMVDDSGDCGGDRS